MAIKRKYKDFLNESYLRKRIEKRNNLSDNRIGSINHHRLSSLRNDFEEDVLKVGEFYSTSFSDMCKIEDANPESDYNDFQSLMNKKGWTFESIKNLFSKKSNDICGDDIFGVIHKSPLSSTNGYIDFYLYKTVEKLGLDKSKIHLGGDGWSESLYYEEELPIRYKYGYHQTEYGKLMIDEANTTVEEFISKVTSYLVSMFEEDWEESIIGNVIKNKYSDLGYDTIRMLISNSEVRKFENYHILEEDRIIFLVRDVVDDLNDLLSVVNNGIEITNEEFSSELSSLLYDFSDGIESTGTELILYGDFSTKLDLY